MSETGEPNEPVAAESTDEISQRKAPERRRSSVYLVSGTEMLWFATLTFLMGALIGRWLP